MAKYQTAASTAPYYRAAAVTAHDTNTIPVTRGIYIGGAGNIKVDMTDGGTAITFTAVPVGTILPIQVTRVYTTDTTATAIVALY